MEVKGGVGDNVSVGVRVGGAGVKDCVAVGVGEAALAVCVAAETIVAIMAVPRALASMEGTLGPVTGMLGVPQASETINKTVPDKRMSVDLRMMAPFSRQG